MGKNRKLNRNRRFRHERLEDRFLLASDILSSQFFSGTLSASNLLDEYSVTFETGDRVVVATDGANNRPTLTIRDAAGNFQAGESGGLSNGSDESLLAHFVAPATGTYLVQINPAFTNQGSYGDYELRVDTIRGGQLEQDSGQVNNTSGSSDFLDLTRSGDIQTGIIAGSLIKGDVDYFQIGYLPAGASVNIDASDLPAGTTLRPLIQLAKGLDVVHDSNADVSIVNAVVPEDGFYQLRIDNGEIFQNGKVYRYNSNESTWNDARTAATNLGGDLVSIDNAALNFRIATEFPIKTAWIGLENEDQVNGYQWSDNTPLTYTRWEAGNPNGQDYAAIDNLRICSCTDIGRWVTPDETISLPSVIELDSATGFSGKGFSATYVANITIDDSVVPVVTETVPEQIQDGTVTDLIGEIELQVNKDLDPASVTVGDYTLVGAGIDENFGTADDVFFTIAASFQSSSRFTRSLRLSIADGPLPNGEYRLTVGDAITDVSGTAIDGNGDGTAGGVGQYHFTVDTPVRDGVLESANNNTTDGANELLISADPSGTAWQRSETGFGVIESTGDIDQWKFDAQAGDTFHLNVLPTNDSVTDYTLSFVNSNGTINRLINYGRGAGIQYATHTGTYYLAVSGALGSEYLVDLRINNDLSIGDGQRNVSTVLGEVPQTRVSAIGGTLINDDDVDRFDLTGITAGTLVRIETGDLPQWSDASLRLVVNSGELVDLDPADDVFVGRFEEDGSLRVDISDATNPDPSGNPFGTVNRDYRLDHQYSAIITLTDLTGPLVGEAFGQTSQSYQSENFVTDAWIYVNEIIDAESVTQDSQEIRSAGDDGIFGSDDDVIYSSSWLSAAFSNAASGRLIIDDGPLDNGVYQITVRDSLQDTFGNPIDGDEDGVPGGDWVRQLTVNARADDDVFEGRSNNTTATATPLTLLADPAGTGWLQSPTAAGVGESSPRFDLWSFEASAGDQLIINRAAQQAFFSFGLWQVGPNDSWILPPFRSDVPATILEDGTYLVQIRGGEGAEYRFGVNLYRGEQLEEEDSTSNTNNLISQSEPIVLSPGPDGLSLTATIGGTIPEIADVDYFSIGSVTAGTQVSLSLANAAFATGQALTDVVLVDSSGAEVADLNPATDVVEASIPADGDYYARVQPRTSEPATRFGQLKGAYELDVDIRSTQPLQVVSVTGLPADGQVADEMVFQFSVNTNVTVDSASFDASAYRLVAAGNDGTFGTADDVEFPADATIIQSDPRIDFEVLGGPLPAGSYRLVIDGDVANLFGTSMDGNSDGTTGDAFTHDFSVDYDRPGFRFDTRNNGSHTNAVELTLNADTSGTDWSRTERAVGLHETTGDVDWWSVQIPAGHFATQLMVDQFTGQMVNSRTEVFWLDPSDDSLQTVSTSSPFSTDPISFHATNGGTYFIKVLSPAMVSSYHLEVQTNATRPVEDYHVNGVIDAMFADGGATALVAGSSLPSDRLDLGFLMPGTQFEITVRTPDWASDAPVLTLREGNTTNSLADTNPDPNVFHVLVNNRGQFTLDASAPSPAGGAALKAEAIFTSQYELDIQVIDTEAPEIIGITYVPGEGQTANDPQDSFWLQFSEPVNHNAMDNTVVQVDNAGPDGVFGSIDDIVYIYNTTSLIQNVTFVSPVLNYYVDIDITDTGWLPGRNRIRISELVEDRFGNLVSNDLNSGASLSGNDVIFQRVFTVSGQTSNLVNEIPGQQTYLDAAELPILNDSAGTRWSQTLPGRGLIGDPVDAPSGPIADIDWFRFDASVGDTFETFLTGNITSRSIVSAFYDDGGLKPISSVRASINGYQHSFLANHTGPIYLSVGGLTGMNYQLQVKSQTSGTALADDISNDTANPSQVLDWTGIDGSRRLAVAETIHAASSGSDVDHYYLGNLPSDSVVQAGLRVADWGGENVRVELVNASAVIIASESSNGFVQWTVTNPGDYYARIQDPDGGSPDNQYLLNLLVANSSADVPADTSFDNLVINGGSGSRSVIEQIELTLNSSIEVDASDFELVNLNTGQSSRVLRVASQINSALNQTYVQLTFDQSINEALGDGDYQLVYTGGAINPANDSVDSFFAKYGDADGNGSVGLIDFAEFRSTFGASPGEASFNSTLDANRDGIVGLIDFAQFRANFGN